MPLGPPVIDLPYLLSLVRGCVTDTVIRISLFEAFCFSDRVFLATASFRILDMNPTQLSIPNPEHTRRTRQQ